MVSFNLDMIVYNELCDQLMLAGGKWSAFDCGRHAVS